MGGSEDEELPPITGRTLSFLLRRSVRIQDQSFILAGDGSPIVLSGPNVVVKGPPYLPAVSGETHCHDMINSTCSATGTCTSCTTFNEADVALLNECCLAMNGGNP